MKKEENIKQGLLQINIAVIFLGGTTLFSKLITLPAITTVMFRGLFGAAALILLILILKQSLVLASKAKYIFILISGVLMGIHWVTFFHSMQISSVAVGIVAMYTFPVITAFIEPIFEKSKISSSDLLCALAVFGGILLMIPEYNFQNEVMLGVLWGVFSAILLAFRNVIVRRNLGDVPGTVIMMYQLVITFLILIPFAPKDFDYQKDYRIYLLILLGVVFTALPHTLFVSSLKNLRATTASLISCMQPFYSTLLALLVLGSVPDIRVVCGGLIVVGAAVYESWKSTRKRT